MSMYNLVHGENPFAGLLLTALGLTKAGVPRYRDCYYDGTYICVHTRTGGGNREHYDSRNDDNPDGPWNDTLRSVAGFDHEEDDDFDSTYATFYFRPSDTLKAALQEVPATDETPAQRWQAFFDRLSSGPPGDPQIARVTEAVKPLIEAISKMMGKP